MNESSLDEFKQNIEVLRKLFYESLTKDKLDEFEETDLTRFREDDRYCESFLKHHEGDVDKALKMANETFKWRKEFGVHGLKEDGIPMEIRKSGTAYKGHHDKQGNQILMVILKNHKRDSEMALEQKRALIFGIEKCLSESPTQAFTLLEDCEDAGIASYDVRIAFFLANTLAKYYPNAVGHVLIYNMPSLFQTVWTIVKPLVPKHLRRKVVFVNKDTVKQFVDDKFLPIRMGGEDATEYVYTPGEWN